MDFQIEALPAETFAPLFALSDTDLAKRQACRQTVSAYPGTPCRVSLEDAQVGETVILLNYQHQPANSPYQATHAIFVREGAQEAKVPANTVPEVIRSRVISLRFFDADHMMIRAEVVDGTEVEATLRDAFADARIAYAHIHNAKPGCFAAIARRVVED